MKTKTKKEEFDTVKVFREIKTKISKDLAGMNFDQIKEYLKKNSLKFHTK